MVSMNGAVPADVRGAAVYYHNRGLVPLPVEFRGKECFRTGWQDFRHEAFDLEDLFPADRLHNIGISTGAASAGLLDVDLDAPEAVAAAPFLLPKTSWIFGRAGKRRSHWLYRVNDPPTGKSEYTDLDLSMLCELRSGGCQTVFPPSTHVSGEAIEWHSFEEAVALSLVDLTAAVGTVAAAALLARHWPVTGARHRAGLALIGGLARGGWDSARIETFVRAVCTAAGDEEVRDRLKCIPGTLAKIDKGEAATGWPKLAALLGKDGQAVVRQAQVWLALQPAPTEVPWGDPIPLSEPPSVLPFPLDTLPDPMRRLIEEIAWAMNVPPEFATVPLLTLAGGALANARHLAITSTHTQLPCLYAAYIAPPGAIKTPPLKLLRRPFDVVQARWLEL